MRKGFVLIVLLLVLVPVVTAETVVIGNTRDWHDIYLSMIYSSHVDARFEYFESLYDSKIKTKTLSKDSTIIVIESKESPIVKNYASLLKVNGYPDVENIIIDDYSDLQNILVDRIKPSGYIVLDPLYGMEAIAATPLIHERNLAPLFINEENYEEIQSTLRGEESIIAGYIPVRQLEGIRGQTFNGYPIANANNITRIVFTSKEYDWGLIVNPRGVEINSLKSNIPVFMYNGDSAEIAALIRESGISNFEVIGADMADISKGIEGIVGRDLKLMLKYAKTMTNVEGLSGKLLDLDKIAMPVPFVALEIIEVRHYPGMGIVTLTLRNNGNIQGNFFSNFEFGDIAFSDEFVHAINPQDTITIPYQVDSEADEITVSTVYGIQQPLRQSIMQNGIPSVLISPERQSGIDDSTLQLIKVMFDDEEGTFIIRLNNPGKDPVKSIIEIKIGDQVLVSSPYEIPPGSDGDIMLPAPYIPKGVIPGSMYNIHVYYGNPEITRAMIFENTVVEEPPFSLISSLATMGGGAFIAIPAGVIILALIFFLIWKRRRARKF